MSDPNEIDILGFIRSESNHSHSDNDLHPNDDLHSNFTSNDIDVLHNDDNIIPSSTMDTYFDYNPQSNNLYFISNTEEFVQTLNQTSNVHHFTSFASTYSMQHNNPQNYHFLNTQQMQNPEIDNELRPFKSVNYHIIKPIIAEIERYLNDKKRDIESFRNYHKQIVDEYLKDRNNESLEKMKQLFSTYIETMETTNSAIIELNKLKVTTILEPHEIDKAFVLGDNLEILNITLKLYASELNIHIQGVVPPITDIISFINTKSPFPGVWMKKSQMADNEVITVQIISSPSIEYRVLSDVKASLLTQAPSTTKSKSSKPILDNDTSPCDAFFGTSKFQFLFLSGTRKDCAQLRFSLKLETNFSEGVLELTTPPSRPFIVITNECQYGDSSGNLFLKDVFDYQWGKPMQELPWPFFANSIQHYFLKATKQDLSKPLRGLSRRDLIHINQVYFESSLSIMKKQFTEFWNWFGKVLHKLRYQRHLITLWTRGLLYGILSREGVWRCLNDQPIGTFLLRYSESNAGLIAIGYKNYDGTIKNYLVKQEDITGNSKSIADFIRLRPEFIYALQYYGDDDFGSPQFIPVIKDKAFFNLYSTKQKVANEVKGNPYDEL